MSFLAERMSRIDASGIRKIFALAAKMENPINLGIGQPDYDVHVDVKEAAIAAIRAGQNAYTQTQGLDELREAVQGYYNAKFGVVPQNVMITSGVSGALFLALMATVNPGDEVIFADPFFVMYKHLINLLGGTPVPVNTFPDFKLTPAAVERAITPKTKLLIVNSPSNPTGVTLNKAELQALADVGHKHKLLVITDEIYEALLYDEAPVTMVGMNENVLLLNGLSKSAGMTGWRMGYAAGPEAIIQAMNTLQQYTFVCAPSFAQRAAIVALKEDMRPKVDAYRRKRDIIYDGLRDHYTVVKPGGAFYIYPEAPNSDGDEFVKTAIENNLLVIPGSVFSNWKTHFRISFAVKDEILHRGVDVLKRLSGK